MKAKNYFSVEDNKAFRMACIQHDMISEKVAEHVKINRSTFAQIVSGNRPLPENMTAQDFIDAVEKAAKE